MAESENSAKIYGNKDLDKEYPLKHKRDLRTYVVLGTPTKSFQVGKQFKVVPFKEAAVVRKYTPEDYERLLHRDFFNKNTNVSYTVLHDPTVKAKAQEPEAKATKATTAKAEAEPAKRTRRTKEQIAADQAAEAALAEKGQDKAPENAPADKAEDPEPTEVKSLLDLEEEGDNV